jgi:hypothetical protein
MKNKKDNIEDVETVDTEVASEPTPEKVFVKSLASVKIEVAVGSDTLYLMPGDSIEVIKDSPMHQKLVSDFVTNLIFE